MDLTRFRLLRPPRAATPAAAVVTAVVPPPRNPVTIGPRAMALSADDIDPIASTEADGSQDSAAEKLLGLIGELDRWLVERGDRPEPPDFAAQRSTAQNIDAPAQTFPATRSRLAAAMAAAASPAQDEQRDLVLLAGLTRLLLVLDAADPAVLPDDALGQDADREIVFDMLRRRFPALPPGTLGDIAGDRAPVRDITVSDMYVVRSEWSCYQAGEIAAVTNVLAGEEYRQESRQTHEEQVTERTETERIESTERTEQDTTATELSREVDRAASLEVSAEGKVDVSGQYGLTKFGVSAGVSASASLSENARQAGKLSRELVSKAVTKVASRVREERVRTVTTKFEDLTSHVITNDGPQHRRGVYRWVDRIDRFQVFRYPDRLQLEFEFPEPGNYLRHRLLEADQAPGDVQRPPEFTVLASNITEDNYPVLARKYHAGTLPPPPDQHIGLSASLALNAAGGDPVTDRKVVWTYPQVQKHIDVVVPAGYEAESLTFAGSALPVLANWRVEAVIANPQQDKAEIEGFHRIEMTVTAGGHAAVHGKGGSQMTKKFSVQLYGASLKDDRSRLEFADAAFATPEQGKTNSITFDTPVTEKVSIAVTFAGANYATASFEIKCACRASALGEWQNSVYDVLLDAWRAWDEQWRRQQLVQPGPALQALDSGSPALNAELVREELKRLVVTWLQADEDFAGFDAMKPVADSWQRYDIDKARESAPTIQFMEQAFEWGNLTYVPYPYFWGRGSEWSTLAGLRGADPELVRFLRAGSVRVIVSARPGFERAVLHFMIYGQPFLGDPLPIPGEDLYVSVATEIHDLTQPPGDGTPGESWEARLPTTLLWLDPDAELPHNPVRRLGLPPHEPKEPLCIAAPPAGPEDPHT